MTIFSEVKTIAGRKVGKAYFGATILTLGIFALIFVMWLCNIWGAPGWALALGFIGVLFSALGMFSPRVLLLFFGLGALFAELNDEDISQGTLNGLKQPGKIFVVIGYWIMFVSGLLGTWSFQNFPGAFWVIAFMGGFLMLSLAYYNAKASNWLFWIGIVYGVIVILFMFGQTLYKNEHKSTALNDVAVNGLAAVTSKAPDPLATIQTLESFPNRPYTADRNFNHTVIIPANGAYFATAEKCGLDYNDEILTATPVGIKENPWSVILLQPISGSEQVATVKSFCPN